MIVQNVSHDGKTDLSFTAPRADLPGLQGVLDALAKEIGAAASRSTTTSRRSRSSAPV